MADIKVPDFGDSPSASTGVRKMCFICSKGNLDWAYPALIMGNAALGEGVETHFFFTFWGLDIVTKSRMANLKFSMLGNTAMHMPAVPNFPIPAFMGGIPGVTEYGTRMMRRMIGDLDVPPVPEFLQQIVDMGGQMWACRMTFDMMKLKKEDLFDGVQDVISATDFIELSDGGQIIFI